MGYQMPVLTVNNVSSLRLSLTCLGSNIRFGKQVMLVENHGGLERVGA